MRNFKDLLRWYNNKDVVSALEAMQKLVDSCHSKDIDMLKLRCTLPKLANVCLQQSTTAKFYTITESDEDLLEKKCEDMAGGPTVVFTPKIAADETSLRDSTNLCKSIVGIDNRQLYIFFLCQPVPTARCSRWKLDSESATFILHQNKSRSFENMVMSYFQRVRPQCKFESLYTATTQKKLMHTSLRAFVDAATLCLKLWEAIFNIAHFKKLVFRSLTKKKSERHQKKLDEQREQYLQKKSYSVIEMCECDCWNMYKTDNFVKQHLRESLPCKSPLREERFQENVKSGSLFGYVQCDNEVPDNL